MAGGTSDDRTGGLGDRLSQAFLEAQELLTVHLGLELGLYQALADDAPSTAGDVAARTGCDARYVREWLEQQAVAGIVAVADVDAAPEERGYALPAASRGVLLDEGGLAHLGPLAPLITALARAVPDLVAAFRTGRGVPLACYGDDLRGATAALNRPLFTHLLAQRWLPALADVDARLRAQPPARVADIGCGAGWAAVALALAYPDVTVHGVDLDERSVADARRHALEAGVAGRTTFVVGDAAAPALEGRYDLVICLEALHDMARPVDALAGMRSLLAEDGQVVVAEERVAEAFAAPGDARERAAYCWSVLHCLPVARADMPSAATGAVLRPSALAGLAADAGFGRVEVLGLDDPVFRFYRLWK